MKKLLIASLLLLFTASSIAGSFSTGVIDSTARANAATAQATANAAAVPPTVCLVSLSANQSIPISTLTAIVWNVENRDDASIHDLVTNPSRLTVPVGYSKARLTAMVQWNSDSAGYRYAIQTNSGAEFIGEGLASWPTNVSTIQPGHMMQSAIVSVVAGNYFEVQVYHTSTVALGVHGGNPGQTWAMLELWP